MLVKSGGFELFGKHYGVGKAPEVWAEGGAVIEVIGEGGEKLGNGGDLFEGKMVEEVGWNAVRSGGLARWEGFDKITEVVWMACERGVLGFSGFL